MLQWNEYINESIEDEWTAGENVAESVNRCVHETPKLVILDESEVSGYRV